MEIMHRTAQLWIAAIGSIFFLGLLNTICAQQVMRFQAGEDSAIMLEFRVMAKDKDGSLKVETVMPMPEGEKSPLQVGDVIVSLNGKATPTAKAWRALYDSIKEKGALKVVVSRAGKELTVTREKVAAGSGGRQVISMGSGQGAAAFASGGAGADVKASRHLQGVVFSQAEGKIKVVGLMALNGADISGITLKAGDVVLGLNGTFVKDFEELEGLLSKAEEGGVLRFAVERDGERQFVSMKKTSSN